MKKPVIYDDEGAEIEVPYKWAICSACRGEGQSSAYLGAFTQSDIDQMDPEFIDDYFAGRYDRPCDACDGKGRVMVADFARMTKNQREEYRAQRRAEREVDAMQAAERRMGA